jgi:hypothetical protein
MERSSLIGVAAALALSMALSPDARASCNSIPDAESAVAGSVVPFTNEALVTQVEPLSGDAEIPGGPVTGMPRSRGGVIGFRGALGRIDRIHLIPGQTEGFRIQPGRQCVDASNGKLTLRKAPDRRTVDGGLDKKDDDSGLDLVVSLLTGAPGGGGAHVLVLASRQVCNTLDAGIGHEARERGFELLCEPLAPSLVKPVDGPPHVAVSLPTKRESFARDVRDGRAPHGPAKVVLTEGLPNRADYMGLLAGVFRDGCAAHCDELLGAQVSGCLDRFYVALPSGDVVHDKIPCEIAIVPGVGKNDFKALCEDMDPAPPGLTLCDNNPTGTLQFWEDSCGGIHIPFDWTGIRKGLPTTVARKVAGRSATSRLQVGNPNQEKRIWIPGREFLGSTPWDDASGAYPSTEWRKPEIDTWYQRDASLHEAGLRGTVDEDDSIVHVYPRMPVYRVCRNGTDYEACMKVAEDGVVRCACGDRYDPASCSCETAPSPMYFQCDGGDFAGMPCTRHEHCDSDSGNSGNCSQKPSCQPIGPNRVWEGPWNGTTPQLPPGSGDCSNDDDCPGQQTCGYRLFDFPGSETPMTLHVEIPHQSDNQACGVCQQSQGRNTNCNRGKACPAGTGNCRGFTLRAEGTVP